MEEFYLNRFFKWVRDVACSFPFTKEHLCHDEEEAVDIELFEPWLEHLLYDEVEAVEAAQIESMKLALKHLFYDEESKIYGVEVNEYAVEKGLIYDPVEILPNPSNGFGVYNYDETASVYDNIPQISYYITVENFISKYPNALKLI